MSTGKTLIGVVVALGALLGSVSGAAGAPATSLDVSADVSGYPTVSAVVTAPGVTPYDTDSFTVNEGGADVAAKVTRQPTDGLEVMLVLDISESMRFNDRLPQAVAAVDNFLSLIPPEVSVGAVAYSGAPYLLVAPTTDRDVLRLEVAGLATDDETATYDAVGFAAGQFTRQAERRAVILLTDGEDTVSTTTLDDAIAVAEDVPVHVVALGAAANDLAVLDRIAGAGGGSIAVAQDAAALEGIYVDAVGTVSNQYLVTYESAGIGTAELTIAVDTPDGVLSGSTTIELPVDAPATTTPPATTTTPATTAPPATAPATTAAPASTLPAIAAVADSSSGPAAGSHMLLIGGIAFFLALLILAGVFLTDDSRRRTKIRSGLGLIDPRRSDQRLGITETMSARADQYLERTGRTNSVLRALEAAGIALRPGEFIVLVLAATAVGTLGGLALAGPIVALVVLAAGPIVARVVLDRLAARRRAQFADQLADNIQLLTGGLKAGHGLLASLDNVASEAPEPSRAEFGRVLLEVRVGRDLTEALTALADRMDSTDFEWVVGAIDINREIGGDLAETLDNVAETIRERGQVARQVQALTAEGRLSAYVLTGIPVFLAVALSLINPGYLTPLFSGAGLAAVGIGAGLLVAGWIWMMRLIRIDF